MKSQFRLFAMLAALAVTLTLVGVASAAPPEGKGKSNHEEIVAYWTPDRIANAKPRELSPAGQPDFIDPQVPGNGNGRGGGNGGGNGGGGDDEGSGGSSVGGASWTGGGLVQDTVGKVLFTMDGVDYVCSGTVVEDNRTNESLVLTAGHCVYDRADGWATNWIFMPNFDAAPSQYDGNSFNCNILPYGCWTADYLVTSAGWSQGDFNEDYGFAVINSEGGSGDLLEDVVGDPQAISFTGVRPATAYAFGYPHASPYDGTDLVYCSGPTVADGWGGSTDSGLKCDMTGGSSGGGWFSPFDEGTGAGTLVSVNSFKYRGGPYAKNMFGPLFDSDTEATYKAAQMATSNTIE